MSWHDQLITLREDRSGLDDGSDVAESADVDEQPRHAQPLVVCASCNRTISSSAERIEVAGRHQHTCVNPAGYVFRIRCYRTAPGCIGHGNWSTYYSWFDGYAWQVACCGRCGIHLGWAFQSGTSGFFGLIVGRIRERNSGDSR